MVLSGETGPDEVGFRGASARTGRVCQLIALLTLHVDDGMLFGDARNKAYQEVRVAIDSNFKIKHWKTVGAKPTDHLGMQWTLEGGQISIDVDQYIDKIQNIEVSAKDDEERELTPEEDTVFKGALQRVRWPVAHVVPELSYSVSALAQGSVK